MDAVFSIGFFFIIGRVYAGVPPDICFQEFKWQDCGMPPKPVVYYYRSGSRCEIGMWRGCSPNLNMFADEYECVQTCIFSVRARAEDYHKLQENLIDSTEEIATEVATDVTDMTETGDVTGKTGETEAIGETGATGEAPTDGGVTSDGGGADTDAGVTGASDAEKPADGEGDAGESEAGAATEGGDPAPEPTEEPQAEPQDGD